jgi:hypothetical protein
MEQQKATHIPIVGFLLVDKTSAEDGYIAALMVTDNRGYPLEFKASTPIRPSLVQKTLYGGQLEHFVGVELCGKTLIQQAARKSKLIVVPDRGLLDISDQVNINMVALWRAGESIKLEEELKSGSRGTIKSTKPTKSTFQPVVYEGRFIDDANEKEVIAFLQECADRFDLVEAFERIRAALKLLAKEDSRYA